MAGNHLRFGKPVLPSDQAAAFPMIDWAPDADATAAQWAGTALPAPAVAAGIARTTLANEVSYISGVSGPGTIAATSYLTDTGTSARKWGSGVIGSAGGVVTYGFDAGSGWTATEMATIGRCFALWSAVANIQFATAGAGITPQINFVRGTDGRANTVDNATAASGNTLGSLSSATISIDTRAFVDLSGAFIYGLGTGLHEIGHAIGLGHAGHYDGDVNAATQQHSKYDSRLWSIMSYIVPTDATAKYFASYPVTGTNWNGAVRGYTWMPLDIMAVQRLYGAATGGPLSGGQIFGFHTNIDATIRPYFDFTQDTAPIVTLYDSGGNNTLDLSGSILAETIDLNGGHFSSFAGMTNNIAIAYGTRIDTAIGGGGHDLLIGNPFANVLIGGPGSDTLDGGGGSDTASYITAAAGVTVDVLFATTGDALGDSFISIENLQGSNFDDELWADDGPNRISGENGNDLLVGRGGNDTLLDGFGDDTLMGGPGADSLNGGAGANVASYAAATAFVAVDLVHPEFNLGEAAGDTFLDIEGLIGSAFGDHLSGDGHRNIIHAGAGDDFIAGGSGPDVLYGEADDDTLSGGTGVDTLFGGIGNDSLDGGSANDFLYGGAGDDAYRVDSALDHPNDGVGGGADTVYALTSFTLSGNTEIEVLRTADDLGADAIDLSGNGLANLLVGNAGDNALDGRGGADTMSGLGGDDRYRVDDPGDQVIETPGGGYDYVTAAIDWTMTPEIENLTLAGSAITGIGNTGANFVTGSAAGNVLDGGGGNDSIFGRVGADTLHGGDGDDSLNGGSEDDTLAGDAGNDTLIGAAGNDTLDGGTGADSLDGGAGDDNLYIGNGASAAGGDGLDIVLARADTIATGFAFTAQAGAAIEVIEGQLGNDTIDATLMSSAVEVAAFDGNDTIRLGGGDDGVTAGAGNDSVNGGLGFDQISGGDGNDTLVGGGGPANAPFADWLFGDAGDDVLAGSGDGWAIGGDGNDTISGGAGDLLRGDAGNDSILGGAGFQQIVGSAGNDTMAGGVDGDRFDFADGWGHDRITDFAIGADTISMLDVTGLDSFGQLSVTAGAGGALVSFGADSVLLLGIAPGDVAPGMFLL